MLSSKPAKLSFLCFAALLLMFSGPALAIKTGDGIVPAIETVCDGDPFSFGLCNAYCEALDCDSDTPLGTPIACANKLKNYVKKSGGAFPPCENSCPCEFDQESDLAVLVEFGNAEFSEPLDVGTLDTFCDDWGPNGEETSVAIVLQYPDTELLDPQGVLLAYWLEDETDTSPASCNELGGGFDGIRDVDVGDFSYGPWINRKTSLTHSEKFICRDLLAKLCPAP